MQMELWRDLLISKIAKNKYKLIFLSLGLFSWYLFDAFYRPTYTHEFPFTQGEHVWNVDVRKGCGYALGFNFIVPDDYSGDLNELFGDLNKLRLLPVSFTLDIINQYGAAMLMLGPEGKMISSLSYEGNDKKINLTSFGGGRGKDFTRLTFRFARLGMPSGDYKVKLNITKGNSDLEKFKASVFLSSDFKSACSL